MSVADLHTRAAQFFLLAEQAFFLDWWSRRWFWELSTSFIPNPAAYLPALAAAVRRELNYDGLWGLAHHPRPIRLSPETIPWYDILVAAWEIQRASHYPEQQKAARLALVRLDGCGMPDGMQRPSRLPEWLAEARQIAGATGWFPLETLAALAAWRTAPGVITAPETLREWVTFWQEVRQSRSLLRKGIAARALLNLPETDLRAASIRPVPPKRLLRDLARAIPAADERSARSPGCNYLFLLDWHPEGPTSFPAAGVAEVARAWLNVAQHSFWGREAAWRQLVNWNQTESLDTWGIDLLPFLVSAVRSERYQNVLWELSRAISTVDTFKGTWAGADPTLLSELEAYWQQQREFGYSPNRASGWMGGLNLYQAGLATQPPATFLKTWLSAVAGERDRDILFVLAQWAPGPDAPLAVHREWQRIWQHRLGDGSGFYRHVAGFAIWRQMMERGTEDGLRRAALEVWRTGTKEANDMLHLLGLFASRFHEVRTHLAAGSVPDFKMIPSSPVDIQCPRLALPPGHIAGGEWRIENERWKMENPEGVLKPVDRLAPDGPSR